MSEKYTATIKAGQRTAQISAGRTITLSWLAKADILVTLSAVDEAEQCRASQRKLAWMWSTDQAKSGIGGYDTKEDCYWMFKTRFLAPTLSATDPEFADLFERMQALRLLSPDTYRKLSDKAISLSDGTVPQVAEALADWEKWMLSAGITPRQPEEYRRSIGK